MSGGSDHRRMSIDSEYFIPMPINNSSEFVLSDPSAALRHAGQNPQFPKEEIPNGSISKPTQGMNFFQMPINNSSAFVLSDPSAALRHAGQNPPFPKEEIPNGSISKPTQGMNFFQMPINNSSAFVLSDPSAALRHAGQNPPFPKEEIPNGSISKPTQGMNFFQMPINNSSAFVLSDPSAALRHAGQNLPFPKEEIPNGSISKPTPGMNRSQKIQDDLKEFGEMIKHHEDNIKYLKSLKNKLEDSILDMQVAIGKYHTSSIPREDNGEPVSGDSVVETLQHIHKYENSAAAVFCKMKANPESRASGYSLTTDVVGVVATLGKVDDPNLSRVLSEYLGLENMLAVVCKTYVGVRALEGYKDGSIDKNLGIHSLMEQPLGNRFVVICLENLRPYDGAIIVDDPQRRLDLLKPKLISGEAPPGFIGFAVNMVTINNTHLYSISRNGRSLRETLFYNLFSDLQVYKSREDMLNAQPYITHGAISLDGGVIRSPGIYSLGQHQGDIDIKFPCCESRKISLPASYHDIENQLKETKWKKDRAHEDMLREQALLEHTKCNYEIKKKEYIELIAQSSAYAAQVLGQR